MRLTTSTIIKLVLPKDKTDAIFFDDELPGFGLRVRAGGSRKYVVHYRQGGIQRRHTLGSAAVLTVDEARRKARKVLVAVDDGKDPAAEKANKRASAALLFSTVVDDYLDARKESARPLTLVSSTHNLRTLWKPLHGLALGAVSRPVVAAHLRTIAQERGPVAANRARSTLSAMFAWAIGEGLCEVNVVSGTNTWDEKPRERVLKDAELAAIWKAAPDDDYGRIVKLLMLTGQRRTEIGSLRWSEIRATDDPSTALIALPGDRTKNSRPHEVPLSAAALGVLEGHPRTERDAVFGEGADGFSGWSKAKLELDAASKVKDWTPHDLRRTAATRMADLGVQPHVIEAVLNHVSGHKAGVAGIYNRSTYATEKRAALDLWASHLMVAVAQADGSNVTKLRRGK